MATVAELMVKIGGDISELERSLSKASRRMQDAGKQMSQMGKTITTRVTAPLAALGGVAVAAFAKQEKAELRLRAALQANGREVDSLFNRYNEFARQMQATTVIGDETTLAMLQQAESLGLTADSAERAVKNSIAMQSAFGVNAQSALRYTAALEQGNSTMLARYIPALRELDTEAERTAMAQDILGRAFSAAESEAESASGKFQQMKNAVGDLMEQFGAIIADALLPFMERIKEMAERFQTLNQATKESIVRFAAVAAAVGPLLFVGGKLLAWAGKAVGMLGRLRGLLMGVARAFTLVLSPIFLKIAAIAALILIGKSIFDTFEPLQEFFRKLWDKVASMFERAINFIIDSWNSVKSFIADIVPGITATVVKSVSWMNDQTSGKLGEFAGNVKQNFTDALGFVQDFASGAIGSLTDFMVATDETGETTSRMSDRLTKSFQFTSDVLNGTLFPAIENVNNSFDRLKEQFSFVSSVLSGTLIPKLGESSGAFDNLKDTAQAMDSAVTQAFMNIADQSIKSLGDVLRVTVNTARQIIAAEIAKGIAASVRSALTNVPFPLNIAAAAGAGASAAALFSAVVPKLAQGGLAFGPTMAVVGDNIGARTDPEVIAPLSKLQGMMGGGKVEVFGKLIGEDIYISSDRGGKSFNR